jgi:glutamate/tyrosine decarboxylase-like PLP-dependent enzyme
MSDQANIYPFFVGAYGENDEFLEKIFVEFLRDHIYWRRNFHPEDRWRVPTQAQYSDDFLASIAKMKQELHSLSTKLKRSTPFFSPRYIGHMSSDLLLPGLLAQLITTLYNPNNVAPDVAPVTVPLEIEVGLQLSEMIGYNIKEDKEPCAWGHLTSGGTIANYEGLLTCRSVKFYPLAFWAAAKQFAGKVDLLNLLELHNQKLKNFHGLELLNLSVDEIVKLVRQAKEMLGESNKRNTAKDFFNEVEKHRAENLGLGEFFRRPPQHHLGAPVFLAPTTIHYSIDKAMKLLGLGKDNLVTIAVDENLHLDMDDLKKQFHALHSKKRPVIGIIGVLGTTEFGVVDPIDRIVDFRKDLRKENLDFYFHIDAAWGGYLSTLFRKQDGTWSGESSQVRQGGLFGDFPSEKQFQAYHAVREADSVTVDPHKLGYLPYGSGAFVARNRETARFLRQDAPYVWGSGASKKSQGAKDKLTDDVLKRTHGQYVIEGSRPGANSAAVYVTHKLLPLHREGFGTIVGRTVRVTKAFSEKIQAMKEYLEKEKIARVCVPVKPETNILCYVANPYTNKDIDRLNKFTELVFEDLSNDPNRPLQTFNFLATSTTLPLQILPSKSQHRVLAELGLTAKRKTSNSSLSLTVLRHTLMNPWLGEIIDDQYYYLDEYVKYMKFLFKQTIRRMKTRTK